MATINSVQNSIHLPLSSLASPRVLMCSASVGTEGSVTLQLRDANSSSDSDQSPAPTSLDNALTIGYPDPEMLADVLGTLQTASLKNTNYNNNNNNTSTSSGNSSTTNNNNNKNNTNCNNSNDSHSTATITTTTTTASVVFTSSAIVSTTTATVAVATTATPTTSPAGIGGNGSNNSINTTTTTKSSGNTSLCNSSSTGSGSSSSSNKTTVNRRNTSASAPGVGSPTSTNGIHKELNVKAGSGVHKETPGKTGGVQTASTSTNTTNKTNSYIKNCLIRSSSVSHTNNVTSLAQIMSNSSSLISNTNTNSNSNCSSNSNFSSSSSNDSSASVNSSSTNSGKTLSSSPASVASGSTHSGKTGSGSSCHGSGLKKSRSKISSPTRHGPQQCQICSKIFGNASALAKHKLTHSDERKYVCAMCSKAFKRQDHLNGHMMTHRNKKPYECKAEGCGKSYCDARSLRRHTENHHAGIITPQNQGLSPSAGTPTGLSLSPATASGDASSPDGATCIRTYISSGGTVVDAATGVALSEEQIRAINLPIKTSVALLSPSSSSTSSNGGGGGSNSGASSSGSSSAGSGGTLVTLSASSPTIALTEAHLEGDGLTREQLDLISKIMQQTKQTSAQVTVSSPTSVNSYKVDTGPCVQTSNTQASMQSRPRTWNMQLLNSAQNVSITVDEVTSDTSSSSSSATTATLLESKEEDFLSQPPPLQKAPQQQQQQPPQQHQQQPPSLVAAPHLLNIVKIENKPVECNLCHRKFKNIPALNGHMRLHGGYFKKDPETKKHDKKEPSGPPLQTASIGVRALIEEKIINKRSKDLSKGAFVVPAPPGSVANHTTTIRRSLSDLESFLSPKAPSQGNNSTTNSPGQGGILQATLLPSATTIKSGSLSIQQIGLPQSIEIYSTKQQKTVSNVSVGVGTASALPPGLTPTSSATSIRAVALTTNMSTTKSTSTDPKDSTLIELLKRGTRIAVTAKKPPAGTCLAGGGTLAATIATTTTTSRQIITNSNRTVIIPSDVQVVPTRLKASGGGIAVRGPMSQEGISLTETTPLSLTISQGSASDCAEGSEDNGSGGGDVYTVTYSSDTAGLFDEAEVFNVADTEMLLQTVDSMQLLSDANDDEEADVDGDIESIKTEHSEQFTLATDFLAAADSSGADDGSLNTPTMVTTTSLPTFQQFHSKEIIMQNSSHIQAVTSMRSSTLSLPLDLKHSLASPMNSPLGYPTPPSSHETITQSSPYVDEAQQFVESAAHAFFGDKCSTDFLVQPTESSYFKTDEQELTDSEKILKLKNVLEESSFDTSIKVEDLLNGPEADADCDLREFAETNLSFLDEDQEFLNDSRNNTSPLSESFFTSGIGSAEEVKEVLREVLPEENMTLSCENQGENIIDLYYLPGLGLQSQMMSNSEDPLLSSSPRDFAQQRLQQHLLQQMPEIQIQQQQTPEQQEQQSLYQQNMEQQEGVEQKPQLDQLQQHQHQQHNDFDGGQQMLMPLATTSAGHDASGQLQYAVQSNLLPQVQIQPQFIDATTAMETIQSIDAAVMMPPIIYTGSTDKEEINIDGTESSQSLQLQPQSLALSMPPPTPPTQQQQPSTDSVTPATTTPPSIGYFVAPLPFPKPLLAPSLPPPPSVICSLQPLSNQTNSILKRRLRLHDSTPHTHSKYHAHTPFRSKLRKPSRTHYTPAPMLNPDRRGVGLYCTVRKALGTHLMTFDPFDDDFHDPMGLVDFSDESKVNLGSAYQAPIPACRERDGSAPIPDTIDAEAMWDPSVQTDENTLMRYIDLSKSSAVPLGSHSEEMALQALFKADGNTASAVLTLLQTESNSFQMKWTTNELEAFLKGLERHGKNFSKISLEMVTKSTGECVQMYYFWKKLCVDYKVSHLKVDHGCGPRSHSYGHGHSHSHGHGHHHHHHHHHNSVTHHHTVEPKPYVCEVPDCSASFTSKAALHGHTRIHTYGRNATSQTASTTTTTTTTNTATTTNSNSNNNTNTNNTASNANATALSTPASTNASNAASTSTANAVAGATVTGNMSTSTTVNAPATAGQPAAVSTAPNSGSGAVKEGDFPCKVCGNKIRLDAMERPSPAYAESAMESVFNKVKSRSAHMKTHRVQEAPADTNSQQQQQQHAKPTTSASST